MFGFDENFVANATDPAQAAMNIENVASG